MLLFLSANKIYSQGKYELNVAVGYLIPELEAYGPNVSFDAVNEIIYIDGKTVINSDNLGTTNGYGIQVAGSMRLFKTDYIKVLGSISYSQLASKYPVPNEDSFYGVRMYVFSVGAGLQINPIGIHRFYPSLAGQFRFNEVGGEAYHLAGLAFFVTTPRFGISTGMDLNYKFSKKIGMSLGVRYNYDNWLNKQPGESLYNDPHVVNFRDQQSPTNGLAHDRRIAYISVLTGINIYFK